MKTNSKRERNSLQYDLAFARRFGNGQNFLRKRTNLHFEDGDTKGESEQELNAFNLNPVEVYIGSAASRETYIENQTNGSCGD